MQSPEQTRIGMVAAISSIFIFSLFFAGRESGGLIFLACTSLYVFLLMVVLADETLRRRYRKRPVNSVFSSSDDDIPILKNVIVPFLPSFLCLTGELLITALSISPEGKNVLDLVLFFPVFASNLLVVGRVSTVARWYWR